MAFCSLKLSGMENLMLTNNCRKRNFGTLTMMTPEEEDAIKKTKVSSSPASSTHGNSYVLTNLERVISNKPRIQEMLRISQTNPPPQLTGTPSSSSTHPHPSSLGLEEGEDEGFALVASTPSASETCPPHSPFVLENKSQSHQTQETWILKDDDDSDASLILVLTDDEDNMPYAVEDAAEHWEEDTKKHIAEKDDVHDVVEICNPPTEGGKAQQTKPHCEKGKGNATHTEEDSVDLTEEENTVHFTGEEDTADLTEEESTVHFTEEDILNYAETSNPATEPDEPQEPQPPQPPQVTLKLPTAFRRCAGCAQEDNVPATVWCCECARCLCTACDERRHNTNAIDAFQRPLCSHRVEYIVGGGGVPILSPLLEMALLVAAIIAVRPLLTQTGKMLNVDYFFESVCPIVQWIRRLVFRLDHALYPAVRGHLSNWCDTEDAFVKIFSDLWIRGILTHTDSFALMFMKAPSIISSIVVVIVIVPLLAIPYAILATAVRLVETAIFPNWKLTRLLAKLIRILGVILWMPCRIAGWCCRSTALGLVMDNGFRVYFHQRVKMPPKTGHRKRPTPSHGLLDLSLMGAASRITRIFWYFYRKTQRAIVGTIITVVSMALTTRIVLLCLPRCGNGLLSTYAQQEMWDALSSQKEAVPKCVSIDVLARKLSERIGVKIPEFATLGEEGMILAKMQDSTENDFMDETLQRASRMAFLHFTSYPLWMRVGVLSAVAIFLLAGLLRRLMFWADLRRRNRYRALRVLTETQKPDEAVTELKGN